MQPNTNLIHRDDSHLAQVLGYLAITNLEVALLLNFKYAKWLLRPSIVPGVRVIIASGAE